MALALVSYEDSSDSDDEVVAEIESVKSSSVNKSNSNTDSDTNIKKDEGIKSKNFLSNITSRPKKLKDDSGGVEDSENPRHLLLPEAKLSTLNTDIDISYLKNSNRRNGPVKITIPSLTKDEDSEPPSKKKLKPSQKGSGLFALLPDPKSTLVPQVVNKNRAPTKKSLSTATPKSTRSVPKSPIVNKPSSLTNYEDSGDEETAGTVDFFSLESKDNETIGGVNVDIDLPDVIQPDIETVPLKDNRAEPLRFGPNFQPSSWSATSRSLPSSSSTNQPTSEYPTESFMSFDKNDIQLDQEAMQQLCGRRDRIKMQEVNLIDVSGDAIMPDSREWLTKQLTEEQTHRASHKKKDGPTAQQKRKHQITYLAFQAKENELELKNQWANNRVSRKQTQAKYGF